MTTPIQPTPNRSIKIFSRATALAVVLIGLTVLCGWFLNWPGLKSILPNLASMKANTALAFVVAGLGLGLLPEENSQRWQSYLVQACALIVAVAGLLTLCEYIFHWQLGIDQFLIKDHAPDAFTVFPGRMSPTTALNFLLLGAALLYLDRRTLLGNQLAQILSLLIALLSGVALLGYAYGGTELFGFGAYNQIAVHTTLTFLIIAGGLLAARPEQGLVAVLTGQGTGSLMARRLLPAAIVLPLLLGWLWLKVEQAGYFDAELGLAILLAFSIVIFGALIWWNARLLNLTDAELKRAQAADLRQSEERLRYVIWATRDAVWDRNLAAGEIVWNEGLQKLFHYRPEEIEPTITWWEQHIHPDDQPKVIRSLQSILDTQQELWSKEYRFQRQDGSYANVFDRGYIIYDEATSQPTRVIGAMADMSDQKRIEQALRESEELFSKAFSATPAGILLTKVSDGRMLEVNDAYIQLVGYKRSELIGQTPFELGIISAEEQERLGKLLGERGELRDFEAWLQTKSGQRRAVLSSLEQVEVAGEACTLTVIYDITERKQNEQALQESVQKWQSLFDILPVGVSIMNGSKKIVEMNPALQNILKISMEGLESHAYSRRQFLNGENQPMAAADLPSTHAIDLHEIAKDVEMCVIMEDGTAIWTNISAAPLPFADARAVVVTTDITARKRAEEAQQRSEALFKALFELSPDSVVVLDPHDPNVSWPIIDCNAAACLMNGYTRDELIGQSIDILNGTSAPQSERDAYMQSLRQQGHLNAEFRHRHKDGSWFPIETSTTLIRIAGRELVIGIDRNITTRKQQAEQLQHANEKLAEGIAEAQERNREGVLLNELGYILQSCNNAEEAYAVVSRSTAQLFPGAQGSLYIIDASRAMVEPVVSWNTKEPARQAFAPRDCLALVEEQTHFVSIGYDNQLCPHVSGSPVTSICIPIRDKQEVVGIVHLQYPADEPLPVGTSYLGQSQSEQRLAMTVTDTISLALSNLRLRQNLRSQSIRDPLTGLYNRRFMEESLQNECSRAKRSGRPVGMIMLDLDRFKTFNDTYGHEAGDLVLQDLGSFLQANVRVGDIACRYGGEEFLLLLPEASLEITRQRAQKLCEGIRHLQVPYRGQMLGAVTLSLGVAVFPDHGQLAADVVRAADQALYNAKHAGRNRVRVARRNSKRKS